MAKENPSELRGNPPLIIRPALVKEVDKFVNVDGKLLKVPSEFYFKARDKFIEAFCRGVMRPKRVERGQFYSMAKIKQVTLEMMAYGLHPGNVANKNTWQYYALNGLRIPPEFNMDEFNES